MLKGISEGEWKERNAALVLSTELSTNREKYKPGYT